MARPRRQQSVAKEFASRLQAAMENNPNCPPKYHGERTWLCEGLMQKGVAVGKETVRKWLEGESLPSTDKVPVIAEVLSVDVQWLMFGNSAGEQKPTDRPVAAGALTNLVAGLIELDGGTVAFPLDDIRTKANAHVHLHAVIRAANYPLHIAAGELVDGELTLRVPPSRSGFIILCVIRKSSFAFDIYEVGEQLIEQHGTYERGGIRVTAPLRAFRQVTTFKERL